MPKDQTIAVYANPYIGLDHEGRLAGAVQMDPNHAGGQYLMIGASYHPEHTKILEVFPEGDARGSHTQQTVHAFAPEATVIPASTFHSDRIRDGEMFLAGPDGAPPWESLAKARNAAIAKWRSFYGEDPPEMGSWADFYPLDEQVKQIADVLSVKAKADGEKASADAKATSEKAAAKADAAAKARVEAHQKSHTALMASLSPKASGANPVPIPSPAPVAADGGVK